VRYRAFGATRFTSGTTPTSYRFTGQREEAALGLYFYNARWYDPALGHFLSPDTVVPNPGNALDYHRYAYVRFNPLKYTDPSGHCPICISVAVGTGVDVATDFFIAQATGTEFNLVESLKVNGAINLVTAGFGGKLAKLRHLGKVAGLVDNVAGHGDEVADAAKAVSKVEDVRHARRSTEITQSVLDRILPEKFDPRARFGQAFYVAQQGETAVAEVAVHGGKASHVIRFQLDLSKAKVLDLTDPAVAKAWGYVENVDAYAAHQQLAQKAMEQGYNVIKFQSYRGPGYNYALLHNPLNPFNFDEWLIPQMVSPAP
jgi:RHS repeat-associated protein